MDVKLRNRHPTTGLNVLEACKGVRCVQGQEVKDKLRSMGLNLYRLLPRYSLMTIWIMIMSMASMIQVVNFDTKTKDTDIFQVFCPRGTYRNSTTRTCMNCGIGTFQDFENQFSCRLCSTGTSTYVEGAVFRSQCFATCASGFRSDSGLSPCVPCGVGNYWVNSTTCSPCPNGGTTSTDTAMNIAECIEPCPAGFFSYNGFNQNSACRPCPRNHYQGNTQSVSCDRCPDNTYSLLTGQTSDAVCQNAGPSRERINLMCYQDDCRYSSVADDNLCEDSHYCCKWLENFSTYSYCILNASTPSQREGIFYHDDEVGGLDNERLSSSEYFHTTE